MKQLILLIISGLMISCNHTSKEDKQLLSLIEKNKDKTLFLNFWSGMSYEEFNKVKAFENSRGNLTNNKFILKCPSNYNFRFENSNYNEIPFAVRKYDKGVRLSFSNSIWIEKKPLVFIDEGKKSGYSYEELRDFLIKLYDSKYILIEDKQNAKVWKTKDEFQKIVILEYFIYYFEMSKTGTTFSPEEKNNKYHVAECEFKITYLSPEDYLKILVKEKFIENSELEKIKKEKQEKEEEVAKNNNKL